VLASDGRWDESIEELRELLDTEGEPGIMRSLAGAILARLLARRGDPAADRALALATAHPHDPDDPHVAGPLAVARAELAWLSADIDALAAVRPALTAALESRHRVTASELTRIFRRAGLPVDAGNGLLSPWAEGAQGHWEQAAAAWRAHGERYEEALELAGASDPRAVRTGRRTLEQLGAVAVLARL
jgi:hypothetical protein